jgi:GntR family transcriptional regulator
MVDISLDRENGSTLAKQLEAGLTHLVLSRALKPGERLPTVRQLARQLRVNRNTVQAVYRHLSESGLLKARVGDGTYVSERKLMDEGEHRRRSRAAIRASLGVALGSGDIGAQEIGAIIQYELAELLDAQSKRVADIVQSKKRFAQLNRQRS